MKDSEALSLGVISGLIAMFMLAAWTRSWNEESTKSDQQQVCPATSTPLTVSPGVGSLAGQ